MQLADFDFPFDPSLIADHPIDPRDQSRLLVVARSGGACSHQRVAALPHLLDPGDLLVVNDTKVMPARLAGRKRGSGGRVEMVLVRPLGDDLWEVLIKSRVKVGQVIELDREASATVVERGLARTTVRLATAVPLRELLNRIGLMPLPPYIRRAPTDEDRRWYQTVFARADGSIAAPTASLHFTEGLLAALRDRGIEVATITLHVGPGTFRPVTSERIEEHRMAPESFAISEQACAAIARTRARGRRVVAVGTTVVRALESAAEADGRLNPSAGETALFIMPGYRFRVVDAMMTNFHLPRTTLLMLAAAFMGRDRLIEVYREAVKERYRFYSYGDAMLIL